MPGACSRLDHYHYGRFATPHRDRQNPVVSAAFRRNVLLVGVLRDWLDSVPTVAPRGRVQAIVAQYLGTYASQDLARRLALFAEDAMVENPVGLAPICGRTNLAEFWAASRQWEVGATLEAAVIAANEALCTVTIVTRSPDGDVASMRGHMSLVFDTALRISRLRCFYDHASVC